MDRRPYSASAVKFSFWFLEFQKEVTLLADGKTFQEIKKLNEDECRKSNRARRSECGKAHSRRMAHESRTGRISGENGLT